MSWDPRSIIDLGEFGDPFPTLDTGVEKLLYIAREKGYEAQVSGNVRLEGVTRFAVSQVTQHHDLSTLSFSLVLYKDGRRASANTTLVDDLVGLMKQAEDGLNSSPPNKFDQGFPSPRQSELIDLSAKVWTTDERADSVIASVNAAEEINPDVIVAGTSSTVTTFSRILNTEGTDVESSSSGNYFKVNAIVGPPESRGYGQEETQWRYDAPSFETFAREATRTAVDTLTLKNFKPGEYEVVLGPRAVTDLMNFVQFGTGPVGFHEGTSFTSDRLGDQIFDEKISLHDLPRSPSKAFFTRLFDGEGVPTQDRVFVHKGSLEFIPYDSFTAAKYLGDKNEATGNAGGGFFGGAFLGSAVMESGVKSVREQIAEVGDGLYVKSFWYNRFTDRRRGGLTGLTRNGLYHIKDGELAGAVRNLRYTESFVRALEPGNVISVGKDSRMFMFNTVPSLHLGRYRFSSVAHSME